ncbi:MAG: two-component system, OmpR family, sensor histidine kinase KdpD [Actinomycetota bacterium]|nr:two-component system, OmpR family, sensor histidine kinase KdpD [Actinomycetota bacterium]
MSRGVLRVYLGAAPGVGKTFAMLDEGRRKTERGTGDVVIGLVETHDRPKTIAQLVGLEVVPRKAIEYRGQMFEEMDVDAILARHPEIALVDELAHTNVPGSRNAKRWQDIEELLDAGINVISTVNIQHLESLNDVVERITGVAQRETVPDEVVRAADQIELVDMSPEALRRRMAHGNVYPADRIDTALANYFRIGNLAALRELALLWVADRVDENLQEYRERHDIADSWETKERVLVALTGAPGGDDLVRRAARIAMRTRAQLIGVHVQSADGLTGSQPGRVDEHRALLEEFGGRYHEVAGADVAQAIVQMARAENATQVVLGASARSRWAVLTRGSVINDVIRQSDRAFDVHVISTAADPEDERLRPLLPPPRLRLAALSRRRQAVGFALALVGLPLLTLLLSGIRDHVGLQNAVLSYLLLVVLIATTGGALPAAIASVLAFVLLNWFFTPPIHTFTISNGRDLLALISFLVVAGVISVLVDLAARRRNDAYRARAEAGSLARMAAVVLKASDPLPELVADLVSTFRLEGGAVLHPSKEGWRVEAAAGSNPPASPVDGTVTMPLPGEAMLVLRGSKLRAEDRQVFDAFATQLGVALESRRLQAEAAGAAALAQANALRTALLAAVSHDLRTPLASIKTAATSLLSEDVSFDPTATRDLLETIDDESDRLNRLVSNLLDMSRLQTGALIVQARAVGLEEVVGSAIAELPSAPPIEVDVPDTLPPVEVDPVLLERALVNIVGNALGFSPPGERVRIQAAAVDGRIDLRIIDRGRGIPVAERERAFLPFQRLGDNPNGEGVGLGLAVAKGFIEAMAGDLSVDDTPGGGLTVIISLPEASG